MASRMNQQEPGSHLDYTVNISIHMVQDEEVLDRQPTQEGDGDGESRGIAEALQIQQNPSHWQVQKKFQTNLWDSKNKIEVSLEIDQQSKLIKIVKWEDDYAWYQVVWKNVKHSRGWIQIFFNLFIALYLFVRIEDKLDDTSTQVGILNNELIALRADKDTLQTELDEFRSNVDENILRIDADVDEFALNVTSRLSTTQTTIDAFEATTSTTLETLSTDLNNVSSVLSSIDLASIRADILVLEEDVGHVNASIIELEQQANRVSANISVLTENVETAHDEILNLNNVVDRLDDVEDRTDTLNSSVIALTSDVNGIDALALSNQASLATKLSTDAIVFDLLGTTTTTIADIFDQITAKLGAFSTSGSRTYLASGVFIDNSATHDFFVISALHRFSETRMDLFCIGLNVDGTINYVPTKIVLSPTNTESEFNLELTILGSQLTII